MLVCLSLSCTASTSITVVCSFAPFFLWDTCERSCSYSKTAATGAGQPQSTQEQTHQPTGGEHGCMRCMKTNANGKCHQQHMPAKQGRTGRAQGQSNSPRSCLLATPGLDITGAENNHSHRNPCPSALQDA